MTSLHYSTSYSTVQSVLYLYLYLYRDLLGALHVLQCTADLVPSLYCNVPQTWCLSVLQCTADLVPSLYCNVPQTWCPLCTAMYRRLGALPVLQCIAPYCRPSAWLPCPLVLQVWQAALGSYRGWAKSMKEAARLELLAEGQKGESS